MTFGVGMAMLILTISLKDVHLRKRGEGPSSGSAPAALPETTAARSSSAR
jgi:hypothetical protein